jgi:hypothetical protein
MSISFDQDQTGRDPFQIQKLFKLQKNAAGSEAAGKVRNYTLAFGVVSGLVFSLSTWLYQDIIYSQAHVAYAWIPLLVGTFACVFITTLAAALTYWANKTLLGLLFWLLAAGLITELIIALPLRIGPRLMVYLEPGLGAWLPTIPYDDTIMTWMLIGFVSLGFFFIFPGLLQIVLVEGAAYAVTPAKRIAPFLFCITVMLLGSFLAGNLVNDQFRSPFVDTNNLIEFSLVNRGKTVDPTLARNMHLGSLNAISSLLDHPRRLFLGTINAVNGQVEVLIDFDGTWAECTTINGSPVFCRTISTP